MTSEQPPRLRIAGITRNSGKMGSDEPGLSQEQLAAMAAAVSGGTGVTFLASEQLVNQLAKRFPRLSTNASMQRDFDEGYEVAGRPLILAQNTKLLTALFEKTNDYLKLFKS